METIIEVKNLSKAYGKIQALEKVSLSIEKGSFSVILGKNGAGKSTLIEIISSLKKNDSGEVFINSKNINSNNVSLRKDIGIVFQYSTLDEILTLKENLQVRAGMYNITKDEFDKTISYLDSKLHFKNFYNQKVGTLSGGQRRKADILRSLIHKPSILILDEPTTGLDSKSRKQIWSVILGLKKEKNVTVILTTHYLEETNDSDVAVIIDKGKIIEIDTPSNLKTKYLKTSLKLFTNNMSNLRDELTEQKVKFENNSSYLLVSLKTSFDALNIVDKVKDKITDFEIIKSTMDDVFLALTDSE